MSRVGILVRHEVRDDLVRVFGKEGTKEIIQAARKYAADIERELHRQQDHS
jgi:hypothetical protein